MNNELQKIYDEPGILSEIKISEISWICYLQRMRKKEYIKKYSMQDHVEEGSKGRPRKKMTGQYRGGTQKSTCPWVETSHGCQKGMRMCCERSFIGCSAEDECTHTAAKYN